MADAQHALTLRSKGQGHTLTVMKYAVRLDFISVFIFSSVLVLLSAGHFV